MRIARINFIFLLALLGFPTYAQVMTTAEDGDSGVTEASLDNADADVDVAAARPNDRELASPENADFGDAIDAASGSLDDSAGSIEAGRETRGRNFKGDLRVGYSRTDTDNRDATDQTSSERE